MAHLIDCREIRQIFLFSANIKKLFEIFRESCTLPMFIKMEKMKYWLFKSEEQCFSYDDLLQMPDQKTHWDGVRNYQARNFMRDTMQIGDVGIFYHSGGTHPHAIGTVHIVRDGYPDFTAWDEHSEHPDPSSSPLSPKWFMVDIKAEKKFTQPVFLKNMRTIAELSDMALLRTGNRLSVMPIGQKHFEILCTLGFSSTV